MTGRKAVGYGADKCIVAPWTPCANRLWSDLALARPRHHMGKEPVTGFLPR